MKRFYFRNLSKTKNVMSSTLNHEGI